MNKDKKTLFLIDLCARLYYRPNGALLRTGFDNEEVEVIGYNGRFVEVFRKGDFDEIPVDSIKLYLRPMDSMTEEEEIYYNTIYTTLKFYEKEDWLNAHHFDYRGLIPMGLALKKKK